MWWAGSKADVYVGTRAFAACRGGQDVQVRAVASFDAAVDAWQAWLQEAGAERLSLRVWLSGGLARPFIVPAVPGITDAAEYLRVAQTLAPQHTGLPQPCKVWIDEEGAQPDSRVAVAVQEAVLERLVATAEACGTKCRITALRPWWSEVLRATLAREPGAAAVAVQDCDSLTVLAGKAGRFKTATTLTPVTDRETADAALTRLLLSADVDAGQEVIVRFMPEREAQPGTNADMALGMLAERLL